MKGTKIFHQKKRYPDGSIIEMKIYGRWNRTATSLRGLNIPLRIFEKGKRVIGYDNAERKGDHRHYGQKVAGYEYNNVDKLMGDFLKDVSNWRRKHED